MDELEVKATPGAAVETPKPQDLNSIKLELDTLPDHMKGKSVAEIVEMNQRLTQALSISESARQQIAESGRYSAPPPPLPAEKPPMSEEEFNNLFAESPAKAMAMVQQQTMRVMENNFNHRFGGLSMSVATSHAQAAASRYPEEFEALENEIGKIIEQLPDKSLLATAEGWDNIVKYARGEHINKFWDYKQNKTKNGSRQAAQDEIAAATPPAFGSQRSAPAPVSNGKYDATTLEIMDTLGLTAEEYERYK